MMKSLDKVFIIMLELVEWIVGFLKMEEGKKLIIVKLFHKEGICFICNWDILVFKYFFLYYFVILVYWFYLLFYHFVKYFIFFFIL